jgi:hypothetical protein
MRALLAVCLAVAVSPPALATLKYGPVQFSGNFETQNLVRHPTYNKLQFIQNRNTVRLRVDWDWLEKGKLIERIDIPFIERSKLFLLYRGVYDGFYDIAPTDLQIGQTRFDDLVGGPINGNDMGKVDATGNLLPGGYSRFNDRLRSGTKFENTLREAYVDLKLAKLPVSFRIGRQQVIWGESDQFRLMDIWNPIDISWHLQQESWDNIRIPLWMAKGLWDISELGPFSNTFVEVVYNPFDFQPNQKLEFLPRPWGAFIPNPLRAGQVQRLDTGGRPTYLTPVFDLQGTTFRKGDFKRNPEDASEVGARFHAVTPQGIEFTANYLYARGRAVGAASPLGVKITKIGDQRGQPIRCGVGNLGPCDKFLLPGEAQPVDVFRIPVTAEIKYPYNHIFGLTGNYFEGDFTASVLRLETAYVMGEPFQTTEFAKRALPQPANYADAPIGFDKRDVWAGMVGFDRPTWIRFLNPKATWFLTAQFFWNYTTGNVDFLRGNSGAGETPYITPPPGQAGHISQGVGRWVSGPNAGLVERLQNGNPTANPSGDEVRRWEHLITIAGTSFYRGGTLVPFAAVAIDPVNANLEALYNIDYFYTNNFIITLQQKYFTDFGSDVPSNDPWGAGGRNHRRDETGVKLTYQF